MSRFRVSRDEKGYFLEDTFSRQRPLRASFSQPAFQTRLKGAGKKSELVVRAVKAAPGVRVLDCTAGLGRDAFVMASMGCSVTMLERSKVLSVLLADALLQAARHPDLALPASRMTLIQTDALSVLSEEGASFDVIYMDPMFPEKKGSAAVRGPMQHLQRFLGTDEDAMLLLTAALHAGSPRVVLKRPPKSDWQAPVSPTHVFKNKNSRYEVFVR